MPILVNKAAVAILAAAALGVILWAAYEYYVGEIRQGFWKRFAYVLALIAFLSLAMLKDVNTTWQAASSQQHQHLYLLGLTFGIVAAFTIHLLEPIWKAVRLGILMVITLVLGAMLILAFNTLEVENLRGLVFHKTTFIGALFVLGLIGLMWRVARAGDYSPDDGTSRILRG